MKSGDFSERIGALGRETAARESSAQATVAELLTSTTHPFVAADLAAASLHQRMFVIQEILTKTTPADATCLTYPFPGVALLTRGSRSVVLRHQLGEWRYFVGYRLVATVPHHERYVDPRSNTDIDGIAESMANFLTTKTDALFSPQLVTPVSK